MEEKEIITEIQQIEKELTELARKYKLKYEFDFEENYTRANDDVIIYYPQIIINVCKILK